MTELRLEPSDVEDEKGKGALERYRFEEVDLSSSSSPSHRSRFDAAYGLLDAEFGMRGELERREVIEGWLSSSSSSSSSQKRKYHLLVAHDKASGEIAAVRDCHVRIDTRANAVVTYLAHVLVLPEHRRGGLASLMRAAPLLLARNAAKASGMKDILLAAEMEPAEHDAPPTLVRLVAYGKVGFKAIDPSWFPYCQPDFRDLAKLGASVRPRPLPLIAIVRWLDHEAKGSLPKRLATAYIECLYEVFATHCREADLAETREHTLAVLEKHSGDEVPLLPLPTSPSDARAFEPLLRERVLAHHLLWVVAG